MSIGYACLAIGVPGTGQKTCTQKNATDERLREIIESNLDALEAMIEYNIQNQIKLFRISSDIIPFGSSPVNQIFWQQEFQSKLEKIGKKIIDSNMRVSMHPGQYTVLNSPNDDVVKRAIEDLNYHCSFLDSLGVDSTHKMILHIGGIYQDKPGAMLRFIENFQKLSEAVKRRLIIENDDKSYNIEEVLEIGNKLSIPVVFDNLHNEINPSATRLQESEWILKASLTWKEMDGKQKIHYSQQNPKKQKGSHSETIELDKFLDFFERVNGECLDIMLEVKDKNLSAVKCIHGTNFLKAPYLVKAGILEQEWSKYKYKVLESEPELYKRIREILKNKQQLPLFEFYRLVEKAQTYDENHGYVVNAAQHVWGYFKKVATPKEKKDFLKYLDAYVQTMTTRENLKKYLWRLSLKYQKEYLINSYYFFI